MRFKYKTGIRFELDVPAGERRELSYRVPRPGRVCSFTVWPESVDHFGVETLRVGRDGDPVELADADTLPPYRVNDLLLIVIANRSDTCRRFKGSLVVQQAELNVRGGKQSLPLRNI